VYLYANTLIAGKIALMQDTTQGFSWSWKCTTKTFVPIKHFRKSF